MSVRSLVATKLCSNIYMEGSEGNENCKTTEQTPLLTEGTDSQNGTCDVRNNPVQGFTLRRLTIIPLCVCYFSASGIYMYVVPQYVQDVMKMKYEKDFPHEIQPRHVYIFQSRDQPVFNACTDVNKSDPSYRKFTHVQQDTAGWLVYFNVALLLPAIFANLLWVSNSDVFGRKFALILCFVSFTVRVITFTLVVHFDFSLYFVIMGNILDGLSGSYVALIAVMFSYVSDITNADRKRTVAIVLVDILIDLSSTVSSYISGNLIEKYGFLYPSIGVSCLSCVGVVILIFLLPETVQFSRIQRQGAASVIKSFAESVKFYFCDGTKSKRAMYILLILGFFFMGLPSMNNVTINVVYQLGRPFCWTSEKIGRFGAIKTAVSSLFGICGMYLFKKCMADDTIAFYSLILMAAAYVVEGLAKTDLVLYSVTLISAPSGLPFPMIRSLMSCLTPADRQGALFASIGSVETLCSLIGAVSGNAVYSATLTILNGFVFLLMAGLTLIGAFFILAFMVVHRRCKENAVQTSVDRSGDVTAHTRG